MKVILSVMVLQFLSFVLMTNVEEVGIKLSIDDSNNKETSLIFSKHDSFKIDDLAYGRIYAFLTFAKLSFNKENLAKVRVTANNDDFSSFEESLLSDYSLDVIPYSDNDKQKVDLNLIDENTDHNAQLNPSSIVSNQSNDAVSAKADNSTIGKTKYFSESFVDFLLDDSETREFLKIMI